MNADLGPVFGPRQLRRAIWLITTVWTLAVAASAVWNARLLHDAMVEARGDIRGGASIAVPMAGYFKVAQARFTHVIGVHVFLWGVGVLGICLGARQIRVRLNKQLQAEEALRERIKELNCFYAIADLIEKEPDMEKLMQGCARLLPKSLFHPELASARITLDSHPFQTDDFRLTEWRLSASLMIKDQPIGMIEVCYLKEPPDMHDRPFLKEEENLIKAVAERLGRVAERRQAEEKLRQLSRAVEQSPASIIITDLAGNIEYVNPKFLQITGYTLAEVLGKNPRILKSSDKAPEACQELWKTLLEGREWSGEFHNKRKNGELFWESASISPIRDVMGRITHFVAVKEDITARKQTEEERNRLIQELQDALARVKSLSGLLPICAGCKKIRDDRGYWSQVESYIQSHSEARFSHGLCPDCIKKWSSPQSETEHQNPRDGSSTSLIV